MKKNSILYCSRCFYAWNPRKKIPKKCPRCKTPYWNKPRKKIKKENVERWMEVVISTHDKIIKESGGLEGIRDNGGIYFSTYKLINEMEKNTGNPIELGTLILDEFAKKHHFNDGNKRAAYALAKMIMLIRRCYLQTSYLEDYPFLLKVAEYGSKVSKSNIKRWLKKRCIIIDQEDIETYINKILSDLIIQSGGR